nr:hypothetical protein [Escherichia coli]
MLCLFHSLWARSQRQKRVQEPGRNRFNFRKIVIRLKSDHDVPPFR